MGKRWTEEDIRIMRECYENTETKALAARLGRTVATVQKRAEILGIKKNPKFQAAYHFTPEPRPHKRKPVGWTHKFGRCYTVIQTEEGFKPLHHVVWKEANGSYPPPGMLVIFKDGNSGNCIPENLELISRADLIRQHQYQKLPPELRELILLKGRITFFMNRRNK